MRKLSTMANNNNNMNNNDPPIWATRLDPPPTILRRLRFAADRSGQCCQNEKIDVKRKLMDEIRRGEWDLMEQQIINGERVRVPKRKKKTKKEKEKERFIAKREWIRHDGTRYEGHVLCEIRYLQTLCLIWRTHANRRQDRGPYCTHAIAAYITSKLEMYTTMQDLPPGFTMYLDPLEDPDLDW